MRLPVLLATLIFASPTCAYYASNAGHPTSKPLPTYCQMGECFVQTVEATDPIMFAPNAVLVRVESQNWHGDTNPRNLKREADSTSYVLCSKKSPATVDQTAPNKYMITFLAPNDASAYNHSNETALALYFSVCHARAFGDALFEQGPIFAESMGYAVRQRDDQPTVDTLQKVIDFAR